MRKEVRTLKGFYFNNFDEVRQSLILSLDSQNSRHKIICVYYALWGPLWFQRSWRQDALTSHNTLQITISHACYHYLFGYIYLTLRKMVLSQHFVNKVVLQKGNFQYFLILSWASISHVVKPSHLRSHALLHRRGHGHVRLVCRVESATTKLTAFLTKSTRVEHCMRKDVANCITTLRALLSWCSSTAASKSSTISL